jgi:hypothetical protein
MGIRLDRNRTSIIILIYSFYWHFFGLIVLNRSNVIVILGLRKGNYFSVLNWIQRFAEYPIRKKEKVVAFIIDETVVPDRKPFYNLCLTFLLRI